jgi:molybdopterin-guanine dinucleotide biosynthesis protein B
MTPPVFIVVGHTNVGKTTFIEKLIPELIQRGKRVATIKHAHHAVKLDTEGKDSWRYRQAGATMSMLVTTSELQLVADACERREPQQLAGRFLGEADLVLAEGFSMAAGAKIEVLRRASGKGPRCAIEDGLIAIVTDCPEIYPELPHFDPEDVVSVAEFLLRRMP